MTCYELKSKLDNLTLVGYEDGEYVWMGTQQQWEQAAKQEDQYEENQ